MGSLEVFSCTDCAKTFNTRGRFNQHQKTHTKPFACEKCNRGFGLRADLNRHVIARHRVGNTRFSCSIAGCRDMVSRKDNITKHMKTFHPKELQEQQKKSLKVVKRKHHNNPTVCHLSNPETQTIFDWWHSARLGHIAALESLLCMGFDIDSQAGDGNTALHCAAFAGQVAVVEYLLGRGAQLNLKNRRNETALFEAAAGGAPETVLTLLKAGSTVTHFRPAYYTPEKCFVDHIVQMGDTYLVEAIIKSETSQIATGAVVKAYAFAVAAARIGQLTILQSIWDSDPSAFDQQKYELRPPIYYAVSMKQTEAAKLLLALELSVKSDKGSARMNLPSLAHTAARSGCLEIFKTLVKLAPESIDRLNRDRGSLLHSAASKGHLEFVRFLLSHNYWVNRIDARDLHQETALCLAARQGHLQVVQTMLDHGAGPKSFDDPSRDAPLLAAFWNNKLDAVQVLLRHSARNSDAEDHETHGSSLAKVARYFLLNGVITIKSSSSEYYEDRKRTLLYLAAQFGDLELAELVLTHPEWNLQEQIKEYTWLRQHPRSALEMARKKGHVEIVELFLAHGITGSREEYHMQQTSADQGTVAPANQEHNVTTRDAQDSEYDSDLEEQPYPHINKQVSPHSKTDSKNSSNLQEQPYSYFDEYVSPYGNEDSALMSNIVQEVTSEATT